MLMVYSIKRESQCKSGNIYVCCCFVVIQWCIGTYPTDNLESMVNVSGKETILYTNPNSNNKKDTIDTVKCVIFKANKGENAKPRENVDNNNPKTGALQCFGTTSLNDDNAIDIQLTIPDSAVAM